MLELRILERIDDRGTLRSVLQARDGTYMPWADVPRITIEKQRREAHAASEDALIMNYDQE